MEQKVKSLIEFGIRTGSTYKNIFSTKKQIETILLSFGLCKSMEYSERDEVSIAYHHFYRNKMVFGIIRVLFPEHENYTFEGVDLIDPVEKILFETA